MGTVARNLGFAGNQYLPETQLVNWVKCNLNKEFYMFLCKFVPYLMIVQCGPYACNNLAKIYLFNPFLRLIQDTLDINPIFGFALHPTLVPPKKSSTHFYVNNRDPLCTKKVPLPSQQETAAQPSQPALTYPSWCCLHFYAGELTIFFPRLGKNHYHHI